MLPPFSFKGFFKGCVWKKKQEDFNRKEGFEGIREVCFPFLLRVLFQGTREGSCAQDTTLKRTLKRKGGLYKNQLLSLFLKSKILPSKEPVRGAASVPSCWPPSRVVVFT